VEAAGTSPVALRELRHAEYSKRTGTAHFPIRLLLYTINSNKRRILPVPKLNNYSYRPVRSY
jgi:hypothetical protein